MRILIVEDDARITDPVADDLRGQNHVVDIADDGRAALDYALTGVYDLILLDCMLPGLDGLDICRRLRAERSESMVLMVTARDTVEDKVVALDAGADDYIVKPFDITELSARVRAVSRRRGEPRNATLRHGALTLDQHAVRASYGDEPIVLTRTEFAILETLMRFKSQIFSRAMLQEKVFDFENESGSGSIRTHITNLRKKIRAAGCHKDPIESVYGTGYRLADNL